MMLLSLLIQFCSGILDSLGRLVSHLIVMSILTMSFADIEKHAIFLSTIARKFNSSINSSSVNAPLKSFLFPRTNNGMPASEGQEINECRSFLAISMLLKSTESITNMMQSVFLQYFSHDSLNLGCPPRSHIFIAIFPFLISFKLNPIVGIVSSSYSPVASDPSKVVLPAFYNPTTASSSSLFQNFDLTQSSSFCKYDFIIFLRGV